MIKAIIVEDELIQLRYLQDLLHGFCPEITVVKTIRSAAGFVQHISETNFDLLFLDVQLGKRNTFELLEELPEIGFQIIVISAFDQYAMRAFKRNAADYLLKPYDGNELRGAVDRVAARINAKKAEINLPKGVPNKDHCVCISELDAYTFIPCQNILYCKSDGNYTHIFFSNENGHIENIVSTKTLLHFDQKLCLDHFIRIHQSILVNKSKIRKIQKGTRELILSDGTVLEIARDRKSAVLASLVQ
ncbi:MAG: LytTR family DNA-binding domain-containing protein [Bacteroidota bacterium]